MQGQLNPIGPVLRPQLLCFVVSLHKLDRHHLHLRQGQVLSQTVPRASAEYQRNQLLLLLQPTAFPPLRHEFERIFEDFGVVELADPNVKNHGSFFDGNPTNDNILGEVALERTHSRAEHSRNFKNDALEEGHFLHVLNGDVCVRVDDGIDLLS